MYYKSFFLKLLIAISVTILFQNCRWDKANNEIQLSGIHKVVLLDSLQASQAIIVDNKEKFFEKIKAVDMMLQMHKEYTPDMGEHPLGLKPKIVIDEYRKFVQQDVSSFTKEENEFITKAIREAFELCNKVSTKLFPENIKIIKTHGKHYGDDTYYTRENIIVIPKKSLERRDYETFLKVILHEVSHIVTRYNDNLKQLLFEMIGFKRIEKELFIPFPLSQRLLTNPDGIETNWSTELTVANNVNVKTIPLIYSNENAYIPSKKTFFDYLGFNYFEIIPSKDSSNLEVLTIGEKYQSTLNTEGINELFKAKFNTDYIIHPDEIIADNFSILMYSMKDTKSLEAYTEGGRKLLTNILNILSKI